jgi:hypothetical protein
MPILRLLEEHHAFGPNEIRVVSAAFEDALRELQLVDRTDPLTEMVAKSIIELAQRGVLDRAQLCRQAVKSLSKAAIWLNIRGSQSTRQTIPNANPGLVHHPFFTSARRGPLRRVVAAPAQHVKAKAAINASSWPHQSDAGVIGVVQATRQRVYPLLSVIKTRVWTCVHPSCVSQSDQSKSACAAANAHSRRCNVRKLICKFCQIQLRWENQPAAVTPSSEAGKNTQKDCV